MKETQKRYLPGLNALRFYAAVSVLIHHIAGYAGDWFDQPRPYTFLHNFILNSAYAVTLFFVLSGFLITYLLLNEHQDTGNISILDFYRRRVLRIWPLYYAVFGAALVLALLGGFQVPFNSLTNTLFFLFLAPNLLAFGAPLGISVVGHLWTIGVEEQFYIVWPHIVKWVKRPLQFLILFIAFKLALIVAAYILAYFNPQSIWGGFLKFLGDTRFECMAIGAVGAYLVHYRSPILRLIYSRVGQMATFALVIYLGFVIPPATPLHHTATSIAFAALMMNLATNPNALVRLEHPLIRTGGDISYGIYMLHPLVIYATLIFLRQLGFDDNTFLLNLISITGTLAAAALSYRFFERPFLRLKTRYSALHHQTEPAA